MPSLRFLAASVLALTAIFCGHAAGAATLNLPATVAYALAHNASLAAKQASLANLEATSVKQHALEFPSIVGLLQNQEAKSANTSGTLAQYGVSQQSVFSQNLAQVGSQYTLYNGSLNQLLAQQARRQVESSRADFLRAKQQLALDVATAFYGLAARSEAVRLASADLNYQRALVDVAKRSETVGRVAGVDVLRAQVGATKSEANLIGAQADEANAREALALQIGAPFDTAFALPNALPEPPIPSTPLEAMVATASANRPDVAAARYALFAAQLARGTIDADRFPQITLNGAFGNQTVPTSFGPSLLAAQQQNALLVANGRAPLPLPARGGPGFWQIGATASYAMPIVDYGTRHANHRAADLQIASAQSALQTARDGAELDVRQSLRGAQTSAARLALSKRGVDLGNESARIAQLQYRSGLISLTDATAAEQAALSAGNDLVNARVAYVAAIIRLRTALGTYDPITATDVK